MHISSAEHYHCRHHHFLRPAPSERPASGAVAPGDRVELSGKGSEGIGDPYFPTLGNGGYDAKHYDVKLNVDPAKNFLQASTTMSAQASQDLSAFNLDFHGFDIARITVNGEEARFRREEGELEVTPTQPLTSGQDFQVKVDYSGQPEAYNSPHAPIPIGWVPIKDGNYVLSEPDGASHWLPCNDHPLDKARYDFDVTVPKGYTAVANGVLAERIDGDQSSTFRWHAPDEMASYLATVNVGKFVEQKTVGPNGLEIHNFFPARLAKAAERDFARVPDMVSWFSERFGPYPFVNYGNLVVDASVGGAALETQTRPVYERSMVTGDQRLEFIYAHELAHQWWGNSVSVQSWKDIWLNEGFACYSHMMWQHEHDNGFDKLDRAMYSMYRYLPRTSAPVAQPGEESMFDENVYNRGAVTLHLLRKEVGDATFFQTLRTWSERHRGQNVTTEDFIAVANEVSGKDLSGFFDRWVNQAALPQWPGKPAEAVAA